MDKPVSFSPSPWSGYASALLATVIWSGNILVARGLAQEISPVTLAFFRWLTASAAIMPLALPGLIRQRRAIRAHLGNLVPAAFLGVTVFNTLVYLAGHSTSAANLSLIAVFAPVFILALARIFLRESVSRKQAAGAGLAVAGVAVLAAGNGEAGPSLNPGDGWMLLGALSFAAYTILVRRKPPELAPLTYLAATFLIGLLLLLPWAAWEWAATPPSLPPVHVLGSILYIGVGPSLVSFLLWNRAVASIGPARAGMIYYLLPVFSVLASRLVLGETAGWTHLAAGLLIISGVAIASKR